MFARAVRLIAAFQWRQQTKVGLHAADGAAVGDFLCSNQNCQSHLSNSLSQMLLSLLKVNAVAASSERMGMRRSRRTMSACMSVGHESTQYARQYSWRYLPRGNRNSKTVN